MCRWPPALPAGPGSLAAGRQTPSLGSSIRLKQPPAACPPDCLSINFWVERWTYRREWVMGEEGWVRGRREEWSSWTSIPVTCALIDASTRHLASTWTGRHLTRTTYSSYRLTSIHLTIYDPSVDTNYGGTPSFNVYICLQYSGQPVSSGENNTFYTRRKLQFAYHLRCTLYTAAAASVTSTKRKKKPKSALITHLHENNT